MSTIGTLKPKADGGYSFAIKTLTQKFSGELVPVKDKKENGPDYRAFLNDQTPVGGAWIKTDGGDTTYLTLQLDDPFLPAPLYANSYKREDDSIVLLWSRKSR